MRPAPRSANGPALKLANASRSNPTLSTHGQGAAKSSTKKTGARAGLDALRDVQTRFASAVMTPLNADWEMRQRTDDGRPAADVVSEFIKPNDRLTSFERLEIYNKQYWFRLIDIMYEDYPGLAAILGRVRFNKFCEAYLMRYPSRSGLLRNLGSKLPQFVLEAPELSAPYTEMASDMARYEWAQVDAFDAPEKPRLTADDVQGVDPAKTVLNFQPYMTLLDLRFAVDKLVFAVKKQSLRNDASNASEGIRHQRRRRRSPRREPVQIIVHRLENTVYTKRLPADGFAILKALHDGATIVEAIERGTPETADPEKWPGQIREWFQLWMALGWFCRK